MPNDSVQEQLIRYAEDLDELRVRHDVLDRRYQTLLQARGRAAPEGDQLVEILSGAKGPVVRTDSAGRVLGANVRAREWLRGEGNLLALVAEPDRPSIARILHSLQQPPFDGASVLCTFGVNQGEGGIGGRCTALAVPVDRSEESCIHWLLRPMGSVRAAAMALTEMLPMDDLRHAVVVATHGGRILAVNATCCAIGGFTPDEMRGEPAGLLAFARQDGDASRAIWRRVKERGSWTGEMLSRTKSGRVYPEWKTIRMVRDGVGRPMHLVAVARDISERGGDVEQYARLAYFDGLTGLPSRRLLDDRMKQAARVAERDGRGLALLFINLDCFGQVNQRFGPDAGDEVLRQVARRLGASIRGGDTLARVGADEFVLLLPGLDGIREIEAVADKIGVQLAAPLPIPGIEVAVGASIGCARFPEDGREHDALVHRADTAMRSAKRLGGGRLCFFGSPHTECSSGQLARDLWGALQRGEIGLVYQPQVAAGEPRRVVGCEALLRWSHPGLGDVPPSQFVPLAERTGAIVPLGRWVLEEACRQAKRWLRDGLEFGVSVNVSYRQLQEPGFARLVEEALCASALPARWLALEITESSTALLEAKQLAELASLRAIGVRVAIDDFGVGYSSLDRLASLPADELKIDRFIVQSVVTSPRHRALCHCVAGMGKALGLSVVAEGIEVVEQADLLAGQGCAMLQGFLIGRPMTAEDLAAWASSEYVARRVDDGCDAGALESCAVESGDDG